MCSTWMEPAAFKLRVYTDVPVPAEEINPLIAELNPICHLLALLGSHHILHVSRIRVKHSVIMAV
jgi:hypothetical protein